MPDIYGRRFTLLLSMIGVNLSLGWILLLKDGTSLYFALFFFGISMGARYISAYAHVLELVEPESRKTFAFITNISMCLALILTNVLFRLYRSGTYFLQVFFFISLAITFVVLVSPESPEFLYVKGRYDELR